MYRQIVSVYELLQNEFAYVTLILFFGAIVLLLFGMYVWLKKNLEEGKAISESILDKIEAKDEGPMHNEHQEKIPANIISPGTVYGLFSLGFVTGIIFVSIFHPETSYLVPFSIICVVIGVIVLFFFRSLLFSRK